MSGHVRHWGREPAEVPGSEVPATAARAWGSPPQAAAKRPVPQGYGVGESRLGESVADRCKDVVRREIGTGCFAGWTLGRSRRSTGLSWTRASRCFPPYRDSIMSRTNILYRLNPVKSQVMRGVSLITSCETRATGRAGDIIHALWRVHEVRVLSIGHRNSRGFRDFSPQRDFGAAWPERVPAEIGQGTDCRSNPPGGELACLRAEPASHSLPP